MKIKFLVILFVLSLPFVRSFGQSNMQEAGIYITYAKNIQDTMLHTGFYLVSPKYFDNNYDEKRNCHVEYNQQVKYIELQRKFLFFKPKTKYAYVKSDSKIVDDEKIVSKDFVRKMNGSTIEFQINPFPLASKENIIRIYDHKHYNRDSTYNLGLTLKLDFCAESSVGTNNSNPNHYPQIGLVVNNQLIAIAPSLTIESYRNEKYLSFIFPNQSLNEVETYKKLLFNQTLYFKNEK